jgi:N-methylhydantoinase B
VIYFVGQENYPVEYLNSSFPVRMRRYAIHADSGGPGRWRGGCGVIREFELLCDEATLSLRIGNVVEAPYGVAGGLAAGAGRAVVNPGTDRQRDLAPLSDGTVLRRGDILRIETGGGGGWGHPYDRPAEQVRLDVLRGFVSAVAAERDYGVTLVEGEDGLVIDQQATLLRRGAERQTGLFHRHGYVEAFA